MPAKMYICNKKTTELDICYVQICYLLYIKLILKKDFK